MATLQSNEQMMECTGYLWRFVSSTIGSTIFWGRQRKWRKRASAMEKRPAKSPQPNHDAGRSLNFPLRGSA